MTKEAEGSLRSRLQPWLGQVRLGPTLLTVGALIFVAVVVGLFGHELARHIHSLEAWIAQLGLLGMLVFVGLVVAGTSLLLPEALFGVAAGVLFGFSWGVVIAMLGRILAAALQYGLAYGFLREPIRQKLGVGKLSAAIQRVVSSGDLRPQMLLRLAPLNQATISYLLGASGVRFAQFLLASIAMLPSVFFEVYLGHAGKHLALIGPDVRHAGWRHDLLLLAGVIVAVVAIGFASRAAYRSVLRDAEVSA